MMRVTLRPESSLFMTTSSFDPISLPPGSQIRRILALLVDYGLVLWAVGELEPRLRDAGISVNAAFGLGLLIASPYILLRDSLFGGMSLGKWLFRLIVVDVVTARPCGIVRSIYRNGIPLLMFAILGLMMFLMSFVLSEAVIGKAGAGIVLAILFGLYNGFGHNNFRTRPDELAGTYVVNAGTYKAFKLKNSELANTKI